MSDKRINVRIELDPETDSAFREWSETEGRSKRRHVEVLMRKLAALRKTARPELERLGLADRGVQVA